MITLKKEIDYVEHAYWRSRPSVKLWTRESHSTTGLEQKEYLTNLPKDRIFLGVYDEDTWQVGTAGLTDINHLNGTAEFSLLIGPESQGKGFGKRALKELVTYGFNVLNLQLIWGETFVYPIEAADTLMDMGSRPFEASEIYPEVKGLINPAAKVFKQVGFKKEGHLKKRYYKFGYYVDTVVCSVERETWKP